MVVAKYPVEFGGREWGLAYFWALPSKEPARFSVLMGFSTSVSRLATDTVPLCHYQVLRYHECLPPVFHSLVTNTVYSHLLADQINFIRAFFPSHKEYTSTGQTQRSPEPGTQSILSINVESWPFLPCFNQGLQKTIDFA